MAKDPATLPLLETSEGIRQRYQQQAIQAPTTFLYQALRLLNQCDINYRNSGNKRLLVELTLIEVAQITQSDDNVPGAGRKPRRLKSLFHMIIRQSRPMTAAPQVAADVKPVEKVVPTAKYDPKNRPVLTTSGGSEIGLSWKNIREQAHRKKNKISLVPGMLAPTDPNIKKIGTNCEFSQRDVEFQWMSMCNRMPQQLSGIAARMKNMNPVITDFPHIEVEVDNQIQFDQITPIKGSIVKTLKLYLQNENITLDLRLNEKRETMKILTRREQYELLTQNNPAVAKLSSLLDLELA